MNTQLLALPLLCAFLFLLGCQPVGDAPMSAATTKATDTPKVSGLARAPMPRLPGEKLAVAPDAATLPKSKKPWSELIIGKWVYTGRNIQGQKVWEFTKEGKLIRRYSYPAAPGRPAGVEGGTQTYQVNGNVLFPASSEEIGAHVIEFTTYIQTLTEGELHIYAIHRTRLTFAAAKIEADIRKVPVEVVLGEVQEERTRGSVYVRMKD